MDVIMMRLRVAKGFAPIWRREVPAPAEIGSRSATRDGRVESELDLMQTGREGPDACVRKKRQQTTHSQMTQMKRIQRINQVG